MKKFLNITAIFLFTLCITGCINKNIVVKCTKKNDTMIVNFKRNKIVKVVSEKTINHANEELLNTTYTNIQTIVNSYNSQKGINTEVLKNNNSVILKITFNIQKMNKEYVDELEFDENLKEFIEEYNEEGFTCTTK